MNWYWNARQKPPYPGVYLVLRALKPRATTRLWDGIDWASSGEVIYWAYYPAVPDSSYAPANAVFEPRADKPGTITVCREYTSPDVEGYDPRTDMDNQQRRYGRGV